MHNHKILCTIIMSMYMYVKTQLYSKLTKHTRRAKKLLEIHVYVYTSDC